MGNVASSAVEMFVQSVAESVVHALETFTTMWLQSPTPAMSPTTLQPVRDDLAWVVAVVMAVGLVVALVRVAVTGSPVPGVGIARMALVLGLVSGSSLVFVALLMRAGDDFAPWIVTQASGQDFNDASASLITATMLTTSGQAFGLVLGVLALIASALQLFLVVVRATLLVALMAVLPLIAAGTSTEEGMVRFKKVCGWILALVLYKPLAGVIYAVGFLQLRGDALKPADGLDDVAVAMWNLMVGLGLIIMAIFALPALIKFITPVAAASSVGSSMSPAGVVGAVATGAVVVTGVVTTAGAGAAAGGGALGSGSAGKAGGDSLMGTGAAGRPGASRTGGRDGAAATSGGPAGSGGGAGGGSSASPSSGAPSAASQAAAGGLQAVERTARDATSGDEGGPSGAKSGGNG